MRLPLSTFYILLSTSIAGCGLFSTRVPEPPDGGDTGGWRFPTSPTIALDNLRSAMERRSSADYIRLFAVGEGEHAGYSFQPDPGAAASNQGVFDNWDLTNEQRHSQSLFAPANVPLDSLLLLELISDREKILGDSADISCSYQLHVGHNHEGVPREMEGRADFHLVKYADGGWYIEVWGDLRATGKACWSDLKAAF